MNIKDIDKKARQEIVDEKESKILNMLKQQLVVIEDKKKDVERAKNLLCLEEEKYQRMLTSPDMFLDSNKTKLSSGVGSNSCYTTNTITGTIRWGGV